MPPLPSGTRLTAAALLLSALAAAAAGRYALRAAPPPPPGDEGEGRAPSAASADAFLAEARGAEARGDVAAALAAYRRAVSARPGLLDRRSPAFLGAAFEARLSGWVGAMKDGTLRAGAAAGEDGSYLFRRLNGGCG